MSVDELFAKIDAEIKKHPWRHRFRRAKYEIQHFYPHRIKIPIVRAKGRVKKGYSYPDLWSFDAYLCKVISGGMAELRDNAHGWPGEPLTFEDWLAILTEIEVGFEMGLRLIELDYDYTNKEEEATLIAMHERGMCLFHKYFFHLWD